MECTECMECTKETKYQAALQYMVQRETSVAARAVFAAALWSDNILDSFVVLPDYASKRTHLIGAWKTGLVRVDELDGTNPKLLPLDFQ